MEKMKRAIHLDFHTMPGIYDIGETFDAEAFAQTLADAKVQWLNAVAQCNLGFCYFPTSVGVPYPGLKKDIFGGIVRACARRGIRVVGYVSTGLNHEQSRLHPEWCNMNEDGQIIYGDRTINFFRNVCYNTGYSDHILALMAELLRTYDLDGLFLDSVVVRPCYCARCTEKMLAEGVDITDPDAVLAFARRSTVAFVERIRALLPEGKRLKINGMGAEYCTHGEIECLPCGGWGYEFYAPSCAEIRNVHEDVIYMSGRFRRSWGDFGGLRTLPSLENDLFDALLTNAQFSVGDHMHPRGGLDPAVYGMVKSLFTKMEQYEPWTDAARYFPEVAVLGSATGSEARATRYGVGRMLGELKYNFDIVSPTADLSRFRAVILPDSILVDEALAAKLSAYLASGGQVIATGMSGLRPDRSDFALWDFVDFDGIDDSSTAYYQPADASDGLAVRSMYAPGILMTAHDPADVSAAYVRPYFDRHWDGQHGYYYTPPEKPTCHAAVVRRGNVQLISFAVFAAYNHYAASFHKKLIADALAQAIPDRLVDASSLPSTARASLTGNDNYALLHIKVTYPEARGEATDIEEHNILPGGRTVRVRGEYRRVMLLPQEREIPFRQENGCAVWELPDITGYQMFGLIK